METLISIVVPVYNVLAYLERCVNSLCLQTYERIEILLIDDGSTDGSSELCDQLAAKDSRIKVIHKSNGGLSNARNTGLRAANGEYLLYVDSDDYIEQDTCFRFMEIAKASPVDLIVGECRQQHLDGSITYLSHSNLVSGTIYSTKEYIEKSVKANEWYAPACFNFYRRQFLLEHTLFFKEGLLFEDVEMLPRLFLAAKHVGYLQKPFYNYILRSHSIMTTSNLERNREASIQVYINWVTLISTVEDAALKKILNGVLIKYYLSNCRAWKISDWLVAGVDFSFAKENALNLKELFKVYLFEYFPKFYIGYKKNV